MQVFFFVAVSFGVLIGFTDLAHSERGDRIPDQLLDQLTKQLFSVRKDESEPLFPMTAEGEMYSLPVQIIDYLSEQLHYFQVELFNSDLRIHEIFRTIFQSFKDYLLQKQLLSVKYRLFTHRNTDEKVLQFNQTSLKESGFDSSLDTKIIIHGYTAELLNTSIFFAIKDQLLLSQNCNVILVDWTDYNQGPYQNAVVYSYFVGFDLANKIGFLLNNTDASAESFHIIGHSLGAHIAGMAGKLTSNLGRITSLDAASPVFRILPKYFKLAQADAKFVDAIHTNGQTGLFNGFGLLDPYGDEDFFPNGGSQQPGCKNGSVFLDTSGATTPVNFFTEDACNHDRAPKLFLASINQCPFVSILCGSYEDFLNGSCHSPPNEVAEMGLHATPMGNKGGTFYLNTTDQYPYCIPID